MNTNELLKLAQKADISGDYELADFIDKELSAASNNKNIKEAASFTDALGKASRGVGNFFGNIGNFLGGYGGYSGPTGNKASRALLQQAPQYKGLGKTFGAVTKEITHTPEQLAELAEELKLAMFNSRSKATPEVQAILDEVFNGGTKSTPAKLDKLRQHAIQNKIINPRSGLNLDDFDNIMKGNPLKVGPRSVQRVNRNTKLLAGAGAAALAAPSLYGAFGPQAPDATGSEVPNGPMSGMPQLGPGMGGPAGFSGGYNGPRADSPQGGNYEPMRIFNPNTMFDPASIQQSAGYAPTSGYTGRSKEDINPAARYISYDNMTGGESKPSYNNSGFSSQPAVMPIQTPRAPIQNPVGNLEPVAPQPVVPQPVVPQPVVPQPVAPTDGFDFYKDSGLGPAAPDPNLAYDANGNITGEGGQAPAPPVVPGLPKEYAIPMYDPSNPIGNI